MTPKTLTPVTRGRHFGIRLSAAEREVVERTAFNMDMSASQFTRLALRLLCEKGGQEWPKRRTPRDAG